MCAAVTIGTQFNASGVSYGKPKLNAAGGKNVPLIGPDRKGLLLSTPLMINWGVNENDFEGSGKKSYDMALQFPSDDYPNADASAFLDNMKALEAKIKADAVTKSKDWFNKPSMIPDVVDALWTPMLKYGKDKSTQQPDYTRAPTLRVKIPYWDGVFKNVEIYDIEQNLVFPDPENPDLTPGDIIQSGSHVALLMQCGGIWFANGKFGITWKLFQARVKPKASLRGKCWVPLGDDDVKQLRAQPDTSVSNEQSQSVQVVDSDDEDEEQGHSAQAQAAQEPVQPSMPAEEVDALQDEPEDESEPVQVVAPKKVKKVVKKKAGQ